MNVMIIRKNCFLPVLAMLFLAVAPANAVEPLPDGMARINGQMVPVNSGSLPVWRASLDKIQQSASSLLQVNRQLAEEHLALSRSIAAVQASIVARAQRMQEGKNELQKRKIMLKEAVTDTAVQADIRSAEKRLEQKKKELAALTEQVKGADQRTATLRLRLQELELERKSHLEYGQQRREVFTAELRTQIEELRRAVDALGEHERQVRLEIDAFKPAEMPADQEYARESGRKDELLETESLLDERIRLATTDLARLRSRKAGGGSRQVLALESAKAGLIDRIADLERRKSSGADADAGLTAGQLKTRISALEKQNEYIEKQNRELRENIAVLDGRTNFLQDSQSVKDQEKL